jgi:hypothetical protein
MNNVYGLMELEAFLGRLRLNKLERLSEADFQRLQELKEKYETILCMLESDFLAGIVTGNWTDFDELVRTFRGKDD